MMKDNEQKIWEIIRIVQNGNPSIDEKQLFDAWINKSEENRKLFELLKRVGLKRKVYSEDVKRNAYNKIQHTILSESVKNKEKLWRYMAAASIAIAFALGAIFLYIKPFSSKQISYIETSCPVGVRTKVILSDSTIVYLNSDSYLKYPSQFSGKKREVLLEGEAYFEVKRDVKHTFVVHTESIDINVLGTHFNVKAYNEDSFIETTLKEGSVGITRKQESDSKNCNILKPDQQAMFDKESGKISIKKVDAELYSAWKDGKFYFEKESFASIAKKLERNFNVAIKVNSEEVNEEFFSGLYDKDRSVFHLLDAMKRHGYFNYRLNNDTIIISKY